MMLERKVRDAELMAHRLMQDSEKKCSGDAQNENNNYDDLNLYHSQQVLYRASNENGGINQVLSLKKILIFCLLCIFIYF